MRIVLEILDCHAPQRALLTFADAEAAVGHMHYRLQFDPHPAVILTRAAAADFIGNCWDRLSDLPFQLVHEIACHAEQGNDDAADAGALCFTTFAPELIPTIHQGHPCGPEIREYLSHFECFQLWTK